MEGFWLGLRMGQIQLFLIPAWSRPRVSQWSALDLIAEGSCKGTVGVATFHLGRKKKLKQTYGEAEVSTPQISYRLEATSLGAHAGTAPGKRMRVELHLQVFLFWFQVP